MFTTLELVVFTEFVSGRRAAVVSHSLVFFVYNDTFRCARQRLLRRELCDNLLDLSNNEVATSDKDGVGGQSQRLSA